MAEYYEFEVSLKGSKPRLWRRFLLKKTANFQDLHEAIQDACGWENSHLFSFSTPGGRHAEEIATGNPMGDIWGDAEAPPARKVKLQKYFDHVDRCTYTYDFGDNWEHEVKCKIVETEGRFTRRLVQGKGTFPPEDCGGLYGYYRCLDVLSGKEDDEEDLKEWLNDWTPDRFKLLDEKTHFDC